MALTAGTRVGPYEILEPLGAGGMGEVYRARDTRLGREVALKVLPAELADNRDRLARFEQEARSASALNHPNIVTIHDIGKADSLSYIAMELVEGRSLREIVSSGPLPPRRLLGMAVQVGEGLAKAHAAGIVHRDLKPENLIVSADGFVKILDFGLAKLVPPVSSDLSKAPTMGESTKPGIVMGTAGYMSPEQAAGKAVDFRSDQFSLGAILYEMATGVRPFQRETVVETLSAILRADPEPLSARVPEAPPPLSWIVERCLAKEPADRYASTQDLARELRGLSEHLSEIVRSGESSTLPPARALPASRSRRAFLTGAAIGLAAGAAAMFFWPRQEAPAAPSFVRYLTYSGRDHSPAASPDGRIVAFASDRDGRSRIWLKQLAGGSEAALTEGPDDSPRFSPDGSMLLFARAEAKSSSIYRATVVGGEARRIVDNASQADWSPDGKRIAFLRNVVEGSKQVSIVGVANSEGGDRREITRIENHVLNNPRWSPDGGSVAFTEVGQSGSMRTVFLVDARTGRVRQIQPMAPATLAAGPAWTPDSRSILYSLGESVAASVTGGNARIIRHDVVSGRTRTLLWSPGANDVLDLLPDGRLVMEAASGRENLKEMFLEGQAPPRDARWLTRGNTADRQPTFSPDGEWIVFSSNRNGNLDLWEISTRTAAIRRLTDDTADDWDPGFTRDGKLIWSSSRSGALEIWIAEGDGSGARQLTRDGVDAENPTATPDGWIVYSQGDPARQGIWKVRPDGSGRALVVPGTVLFPEVSPDGRYVAYASIIGRGGEVRVARLEDGRTTPFRIPIQTALSAEVGAVGRSKWMPDGKTIIFFEHEEGQPYGLYAQSFDPARDTSATRRRLAGFDPDVWFESFGISPDGSRMVVGAYERLSNLLIAERVPGLSPRSARSR